MRRFLVVLLLVPAAAAGIENPDGPFPTDLYLHFDGPQDMVISPQPPPEIWVDDDGHGLLTHSTCVETPGQGFTGTMHHTWYAYVSPTPVIYAPEMKPGSDRGILADLHLTSDMELRFYLSSSMPTPAPEVVLRATVREGDDISVDHVAMDSGRLVSQAQTDPATLSPALSGHPHVAHHEVGEGDVYGFTLGLPVERNTTIPATESFNLRIDLFIQNALCSDEDYLMTDTLAHHTSPHLRPLLTFEMRQPVRIERLAVALEDDLLQFRAEVAPVFGSAHAVLRQDAFQVSGPTTPKTVTAVSWNNDPAPSDGTRVFPSAARHDSRLHALGSWAFAADDAASGEYTLHLEIPTESGAAATADVPFTLGARTKTCSVLPTGEPTCALHGEGEKRTPVPLWVALGALVVLLRRR